MTHLLTYEMPYFTGLARDVIVNTWHFNYLDGSPDGQAFDDLATGMQGAYDGLYDSTGVSQVAAPWVDWDQARIRIYDLSDPPPRSPVFEQVRAIDASTDTSTSFPMETSCVLSYRADYTGGINRQRQRGRVFLGGLTSATTTNGTTSTFPLFSTTYRSKVAAAALTIMDLSLVDWQWVVYSRAGGGATYPVVGGWVDAEHDTQRRRGNVNVATRTPWAPA